MKKSIIITSIIICSFIFAIAENAFIVSAKDLIPFLFTILGLCLTAYTFIYSPITNIIGNNNKNNKKLIEKLDKLLKSFEDDMLCIFFLTIGIIVIDFLKKIDIPILEDINDIDLKIFQIKSIKHFITNILISLAANFAIYAVYDLIQATFKILRKSFNKPEAQ